MKSNLTVRLVRMLACLAGATLFGAEAPAPRYQLLANELAVAFLKSAANGDDALPAFLENQQARGAALRAAVEKAVAVGRVLIADGVTADSKYFSRLIADSTGVAASAAGAGNAGSPPTAASPAAPAEATTSRQKAQSEWLSARREAISKETGDVLKEAHWFFHSGLRTLAPYTVDGASVLHSDKNRVSGFLEFIYSDVWAWSELRRAYTNQRVNNTFELITDPNLRWADDTAWSKNQHRHGANPDLFHVDWSALLDRSNGFDVHSRLSFEFGSQDQASASVIAGSGDVSFETSLEKHLVRGWTPFSVYSLSLTGSGGLVTDRLTARAHPRALLGFTYSTAFDDPLRSSAESRRAMFRATFGRTLIDTISYLDRSSSTLRTVSPGVPRYTRRYTNGLEAEAYFPLFKQSFLTLGARIYYPSDPTPWSLFLGLTTPLADVVGGLFPK